MENNENVKVKKEKKGITGFLVFIIVVLLLVICTGTGWYLGKNGDLFNNNKQETTSNENKNETKSDKTEVATTKEMTADEIYAKYSKNIQNNIKKEGKELSEELAGNSWYDIKHCYSLEEFPINGSYINEKLEAYLTVKETGDKIKILDNAINCGVCSEGNGGVLYLIWAVDVNGDLYTQLYNVLDTNNDKNFKLTKSTDMKNITEVVQCSGPSANYAIAVDILGNTYNLQ